MATKYQWNDRELGEAIEKRDYQALETLISSGRNINLCEGFYKPARLGFPHTYYNALYYAVGQKDITLVKFLFANGVKLQKYSHIFSRIILFYKDEDPEIFIYLCMEAYKKITNNLTPVYPEMVDGLVKCFNIKTTGFLYYSLIGAAQAHDAAAVKMILHELLQKSD
jgi:hypothetical protein